MLLFELPVNEVHRPTDLQGSIASFGQIHEEFTADPNGIAVRVTRDDSALAPQSGDLVRDDRSDLRPVDQVVGNRQVDVAPDVLDGVVG